MKGLTKHSSSQQVATPHAYDLPRNKPIESLTVGPRVSAGPSRPKAAIECRLRIKKDPQRGVLKTTASTDYSPVTISSVFSIRTVPWIGH